VECKYPINRLYRALLSIQRTVRPPSGHCPTSLNLPRQANSKVLAKDKRSRKIVHICCSLKRFIDLWAQHIPKRYRHAVRYFGLFAPRAINQMLDRIFETIGATCQPRPAPPRWAESLRQMTGRDPLLDSMGQQMRWARRLKPHLP
jgi:hypothetical protein